MTGFAVSKGACFPGKAELHLLVFLLPFSIPLFPSISSSLTVLDSCLLFCESCEPQNSITDPFSLSGFNGEEGISGGGRQDLGPRSHDCKWAESGNNLSWISLCGRSGP